MNYTTGAAPRLSIDTRLTGRLLCIMQDKIAAMIGNAAIAECYRRGTSDDYYGTLATGCRFEWPDSGVITVYPKGQ